MYFKNILAILAFQACLPGFGYAAVDAQSIIKAAIDNYRDVSSYSETEMIIHRTDWERRMVMKVWTEGTTKSLVRVVAPKKDAGSGNLLIDKEMWSYTPKINRVIKIPSSMANQSWMGSDFTNNDIARADDLIDKYDHTLIGESEHDGHKVFIVESIPHEDAPVVWGKEIVKVRDDYVVLEHSLYDQDGILVKRLDTKQVKNVNGKSVATWQRMQKVTTPLEWTDVKLSDIKFGINIPNTMFTLSSLRNPRE